MKDLPIWPGVTWGDVAHHRRRGEAMLPALVAEYGEDVVLAALDAESAGATAQCWYDSVLRCVQERLERGEPERGDRASTEW